MRSGPVDIISRRVEFRKPANFLRRRAGVDFLCPSSLNRPCGIDGREIPPVEAWPVTGRNGRVELIAREEREKRLGEGRITFAFDPQTKLDYLVAKEAFDDHAGNIYRYESQQALAKIELFCRSKGFPRIDLRMNLFQRVESAIIKRSIGYPKNLRHLSFMLRELAETGCDFLTATALLLHNLPRKEAERLMLGGQKVNNVLRKTAAEILDIVQRFNEINGICYSPPPKRLQHHIQNFMDALIKIARGNGRALLLYFIHKLSSLTMQTEDAADITFKAVEEFTAPSAERLGLIMLASKLRNEAFRLHDPEQYAEIERGIISSLGMTRKRAEDLLDGIRRKMEEALAPADCGLAQVTTRVKTPWGARAKANSKEEYRVEDYSDILLMEDLLACRGVTKKPLSLSEAKKMVRSILGEDFSRFSDEQTETKYYQTGEKNIEIHHIGVVLKNGNPIEFQFLTEEAYQEIERGYLSHWAYKLELLTGQQFDRDFLEACAKEMNGDILHDAEVIYKKLKPWIYAFFNDPRYLQEVIRVIRRQTGAIPLEVVPWIIGKDLSSYAGVRTRKIWDGRYNRAKEDQHVEDGDFIDLISPPPGEKTYLTPFLIKSLMQIARDPLTRFLLHFNGNEEKIGEAAQCGKRELLTAANRLSIHFNAERLEAFAVRNYHMNTSELLAAVNQKIISLDEILRGLAGPAYSF